MLNHWFLNACKRHLSYVATLPEKTLTTKMND